VFQILKPAIKEHNQRVLQNGRKREETHEDQGRSGNDPGSATEAPVSEQYISVIGHLLASRSFVHRRHDGGKPRLYRIVHFWMCEDV
jgi:hypothetical protein